MPQKKKPKVEGIVALIISVLASLIITVDVLTTDFVNDNNITTITGHYIAVHKLRPPRGSLNYDLFIQESPNVYKIGADDADCFAYDSFISEVSSRQLIKISIRQKNGLLKNSNLLWVVAIEANGSQYLDLECINENLKNNKVEMPFFALGLITVGFLIYKFKR